MKLGANDDKALGSVSRLVKELGRKGAMYLLHKIVFAVFVLAGALVAQGGSLRAAELVMFEEPNCPWCRRWHAEIGPAYSLTAEWRAAPLRRSYFSRSVSVIRCFLTD